MTILKANGCLLFLLLTGGAASSQRTKASYPLLLPDSVKAVQYYATATANKSDHPQEGILFSGGRLGWQVRGSRRNFFFEMGDHPELVVKGLHVTAKRSKLTWRYDWKDGNRYSFLLTVIADSATQATWYTGYVFLPETGQWKLMGSFHRANDGKNIQSPAIWSGNKRTAVADLNNWDVWVQRERGSWKWLGTPGAGTAGSMPARPQPDVTHNIDSVEQRQLDMQEIKDAVAAHKIDTTGSVNGVFYQVLKQGTGDYVKSTDTVNVYYKGTLLKDGSIFDQTKEGKPANFPLTRLIRGWQIGLTACRVGGSIRLFIPSALGYSNRSRSKAIPPASVLVFDIDVLGSKSIK